MRLICGLFLLDGALVERDLVAQMARGMIAAHLSPSIRLWASGNIGMAAVDFTASSEQTRLDAHAGHILAADRRLDEPESLAARFDCVGADEDALLAAAIACWGNDAPKHLLGDFAFAHWNPGSQRLLCARDVFGVRPFHYLLRPGKIFAFASFPSGLHAMGVERTFDQMALARHLVQRQKADESLFTGIARLPAAHVLEVSASGLSMHRYWQPAARTAGRDNVSPEEAAAEIRSHLARAVHSRMPQSGRVGAHLSGGLDSSAIAILAARQLRAQGAALRTWSFFDPPRNDVVLEDESAQVEKIVSAEPGIVSIPVYPPRDAIDAGLFHPDLPLPIGPEDPDCAVCADAAAANIDLILSGWGGDEAVTFNGRGALAEHLLHGRWRTLVREITALRRAQKVSYAALIRSEFLAFLLPPSVHERRAAKRGSGLQLPLLAGLAPDVSAKLNGDNDQRLSIGPDAVANRIRLIGSPHIAQRCENWAAQGAQYGVAFAFPMLDRRVVEYALSLPSSLYLRQGVRRRLFRDAMAGILPPSVLRERRKLSPFPSMPLIFSEQRDAIASRLSAAATDPVVRDLFDISKLNEQLADLPAPEGLKLDMKDNATPAPAFPALRHTLRLINFVAQKS